MRAKERDAAGLNCEVPRGTRSGLGKAEVERNNRFISEHLQRTFTRIYQIVRNADDAQCLTQDAFIEAMRDLDRRKGEEKAAHRLSRIAIASAIDFLRARNSTGDGQRTAARGSEFRHLEGCLHLLTARESGALLLRDVEGLAAPEVAQHLGCSRAAVRPHLANARNKFRQYMDDRQSGNTGDRQ